MPTALSCALLNARATEVRAYLAFLQAALERGTELHARTLPAPFALDMELTHTLKANTYLLLYNVVEATMTQLIADIHRTVKQSGAVLDELHPQMYLHILQRFRTSRVEINDQSAPVPSGGTIIDHWLRDYEIRAKENKNYQLSGNVDSKRIREIGRDYGFASLEEGKDTHLSHASLLTTKNRRNKLAHGELSFRDCGQTLAYTDVDSDANGLLNCLASVVGHVDDYLTRRLYLRVNALPPAAPAPPPPPT
ncbi:MAG: MAE_28990/MAE_18760 family HEPN-like nuclease [Burkholderiaceae bacterium]|nr:MAE_28990/MAE_18760 family HEPN-like nuclease [Burkholderiaceae bacterium]